MYYSLGFHVLVCWRWGWLWWFSRLFMIIVGDWCAVGSSVGDRTRKAVVLFLVVAGRLIWWRQCWGALHCVYGEAVSLLTCATGGSDIGTRECGNSNRGRWVASCRNQGSPKAYFTNRVTVPLELLLMITKKAGACEYGNELSGSIKCGEFLD